MRLNITHSYVNVDAPIDVRRELVSLLSARPSGYRHIPSFKKGHWDGFIRLYDKKLNRFPVGLLFMVLEKFPEFEIIDHRSDIVAKPVVTAIGNFHLRGYQSNAVQMLLDCDMVGTLGMATNAGKTLIAASLFATLNYPSMIYVVPSTALLEQTYQDFTEYFPGIIFNRMGAGHKELGRYNFVTLDSLGKLKPEADLLIVDECHRGSNSDRLFDLMMGIDARCRVGMSGTPLHYEELSDMKLAATCGPVVYTVSNTNLIEQGFSTPPKITFITMSTEVDDELKWQDAYRKFVVDNVLRNLKVAELAYNHGRQGHSVMIMTNWIEHADSIAQLLSGDYIYLSGSMPAFEVSAGMEQFRHSGGVLLCTPILSEGVNLPNVDVLILAAGGKSHIQLLQRLGRGMRKSEGKQQLYVYDFIDTGNKYTFKHSKSRFEVYREQGFEIEVRK